MVTRRAISRSAAREKLEDRHQKSFAALEANMMKTGEGAMQYGYNAQAATSEDWDVAANDMAEEIRVVRAGS
jgi:hypothetical protein